MAAEWTPVIGVGAIATHEPRHIAEAQTLEEGQENDMEGVAGWSTLVRAFAPVAGAEVLRCPLGLVKLFWLLLFLFLARTRFI